MRILDQKSWAWTLYELQPDRLVLAVMCGSVALFEMNIPLDEVDLAQYRQTGHEYIEALAGKVMLSPKQFQTRHIHLDTPESGQTP